MKKLITFLTFLLIVSIVNVFAQTPMYYNYNTGANANSFPLNQAAGKMCQWLVLAGEFNSPTGARHGNITNFYCRIATGYPLTSTTYTTFKLIFGQTSLTTLPGSFYTGTMDTVFQRASVTMSAAADTWLQITLDHPFPYDSTKSLVIQMEQCAASGATATYSLAHTNLSGNRRGWSVGGCPFAYYGSGVNVLNCGIDVAQVIPNGWVEQTSGVITGLNTVSAVNDQVGWVGGNSGVVLRTTNAGVNWTNVTGTPIGTDAVYAICGIDANTCLVSTSPANTFVYKTTNGGANWSQVFTQVTGFIDDIKAFSATNIFMYGDPVGARWSLWKSTNAGTTWDSTGLYLPQAAAEAGWNNAMCIKGTNVWFGTNNTKVYYSTNSGTNWLSGATTGTVNGYSVAFNTTGIGFTGQSVAVKSTNGGANWALFTVPGTGTIFGFCNMNNEFWYGMNNVIYASTDNGATFAAQYTNTVTTTVYQSLSFAQANNVVRGWAVAANGVISRYNENMTAITRNENKIPSSYVLSQNYPNPFNPTTNITYSIPKAGNVRLTVFDILGREVSVLVNEFKAPGSYNVDFNASNIGSGVYFYRIEAGDFSAVKKMALVK